MRQSTAIFIALTLFSIAIAQTTKPAVPTGNWKWSVTVQGGQTIEQSAKLKQDGDKLTGTFTDGFDNTSYDIKEGKLKDDMISFAVTRPVNDASLTLNFSGKLEADAVKGKVVVKFGDEPLEMDWNAKRADDTPTTKPAP